MNYADEGVMTSLGIVICSCSQQRQITGCHNFGSSKIHRTRRAVFYSKNPGDAALHKHFLQRSAGSFCWGPATGSAPALQGCSGTVIFRARDSSSQGHQSNRVSHGKAGNILWAQTKGIPTGILWESSREEIRWFKSAGTPQLKPGGWHSKLEDCGEFPSLFLGLSTTRLHSWALSWGQD